MYVLPVMLQDTLVLPFHICDGRQNTIYLLLLFQRFQWLRNVTKGSELRR